MAKRKAPPLYSGTLRQWKAKKRQEFAEVLRAINVFSLGCAYTPEYPDHIAALERQAAKIAELLSVRQWGR